MKTVNKSVMMRLTLVLVLGSLFCLAAVLTGLVLGSSGYGPVRVLSEILGGAEPSVLTDIVWRLRLPRVVLALLVGASLSLGGLVFQALLRNPLAEPYILGVSGGAAVGAVLGILLGLSAFPGVNLTAFGGSMATLVLVLFIASGRHLQQRHTLLLAGVMVNALCAALILFLLSLVQDARLHSVLFWMMGDLSLADPRRLGALSLLLMPCFLLLFIFSYPMNLLQMGREGARSMGLRVDRVSLVLLVTTSFMVSVAVCQSGLLGFVGLVVPHVLRLALGPDHRVLVPACVLGGGGFLVLCDTLARTIPSQGEMPVGVVTALIGVPVFIMLLKRSVRP